MRCSSLLCRDDVGESPVSRIVRVVDMSEMDLTTATEWNLWDFRKIIKFIFRGEMFTAVTSDG